MAELTLNYKATDESRELFFISILLERFTREPLHRLF